MSPEPRDELDRALGAGLSSLAPEDTEHADDVLTTLQPRYHRARTRARVAKVGAIAAALVVVAGIAALAVPDRGDEVSVQTPPSAPNETVSTNPASTTVASSSPTTARGSVPTTSPTPATTPRDTSPGVAPGSTPRDTSTQPTTPTAETKTYDSAGGSVTIRFANGALTLVAMNPASGWQGEVTQQKADDIEVRFSRADDEWRIRVRVDNGALRPEITSH
jgi:hypothetical protein